MKTADWASWAYLYGVQCLRHGPPGWHQWFCTTLGCFCLWIYTICIEPYLMGEVLAPLIRTQIGSLCPGP